MPRIRRKRHVEESGRVFRNPPRFLQRCVHVRTKLNEEITEAMCNYVYMGAPYDVAAEAVGVAASCEARWRQKGMAYITELEETGAPEYPKHQIYAEYAQAVVTAKARWQMRVLQRSFQDSFRTTWIRDLALLERRDSNNWRLRTEDVSDEREQYNPDESFL